MDGQHWGKFGDEADETGWTPWDDIYDGERLSTFIHILNAPLLISTCPKAPGFISSLTIRWVFLQAYRSRTSLWKPEGHGAHPNTATLPA